MKSPQVVIPAVMRRKNLEQIHQGPLGMIKSKAYAEVKSFGPRCLDNTKDMVKGCGVCRK